MPYPDDLRNFITVSGDAALEVINLADVEAFKLQDVYQWLAGISGTDLQAIIDFYEKLPIFRDGQLHKVSRKDFARVMASERVATEARVSTEIKKIGTMLACRTGRVDVLAEIVEPIWDAAAIKPNFSFAGYHELVNGVAELLATDASLTRRVRINRLLSELLASIDMGKDPAALYRLGLSVLGAGPLKNSLALSLYSMADNCSGMRLNECNLPKHFTQSGLPSVARVSKSEMQIKGQFAPRGKIIECDLTDKNLDTGCLSNRMYGVGAHTCLGAPLSRYIWKNLMEEVSKVKKKIRPVSIRERERTPFRWVDECIISLS